MATDSTASGSPGWLDTLTNLANKAADIYGKIETARNSGNSNLPGNTGVTGRGTASTLNEAANGPWYRQPWVVPVAIGGGLLLVVLVVLGLRKK